MIDQNHRKSNMLPLEKIHIRPNGQWILLKWNKQQWGYVNKWKETGDRRNLSKLPPVLGKEREPMLQTLKNNTEHRINQKTGETEFLLHRTHRANSDPFSTPVSYLGFKEGFNPKTELPKEKQSPLTSWTTDKDFAKYWLDVHKPAEEEGSPPHKITSQWIPARQIHSHFLDTPESDHDENEVLVHPEGYYK